MSYQPVIGLEMHAVMETQSKMFCDCPVVDSTHAEPNDAVCPVCAGMPGMLPVLNKAAVEYALRVALALNCEIQLHSIFERKSYFYPDLPKGFQISQYQEPLAVNGWLEFESGGREERVRIRRVHLEEDTGKLTHREEEGRRFSLVDLNRSGIPLLEIVTEPDLHSPEAVRDFAYELRSVLRYLGVNSGNLEKGLLRIEPNISIRPKGSEELFTRVEVKNLNSFRSVERAVEFEIERQSRQVAAGEKVLQQTLGWDDLARQTLPQRSKEVAEDYRYFPEPDLPPLMLDEEWIAEIRAGLPEMPSAKRQRFVSDYGLKAYDAAVLAADREVGDFFERSLRLSEAQDGKEVANWITGALFARLNDKGLLIGESGVSAQRFAALMDLLGQGRINPAGARQLLDAMFASQAAPAKLMDKLGLEQVSSDEEIGAQISKLIAENPANVAAYLGGKTELLNWFFGQVMGAFSGKANPQVVREGLQAAFAKLEQEQSNE